MTVSVIIPVYRVEKFIRRCASSLMGQTLRRDVEFIFVDDCSPDGSISILREVLQSFPERASQVRILTHDRNRGLPAARNTGLREASGKYIFHCDSDDYMEADALEKLADEAERKNADIVWCDWYLSFGHNERYMKQPRYDTAEAALKGILKGRMKYNVWNKLVRKSLYDDNGIRFPEGHGMGEDMTMIRLFACASAVGYVPEALYHYVKTNGEAFTCKFSDKNLEDILYNTEHTVEYVGQKFGQALALETGCFKLSVKYPFLMSGDRKMYGLWSEWFPEANAFILKNDEASVRSRILQLAASRRQFWLVRLHYIVVYHLIYGVIYR